MKKILKEWNKFLLLEKSASRMLYHMQRHDTAFVTAYRNDPTDFTKCMPIHSQNPDNKERNKPNRLDVLFWNKVNKIATFFSLSKLQRYNKVAGMRGDFLSDKFADCNIWYFQSSRCTADPLKTLEVAAQKTYQLPDVTFECHSAKKLPTAKKLPAWRSVGTIQITDRFRWKGFFHK